MKMVLFMSLLAFALMGCSSHTPNPNVLMMDKSMGELDRETAK